MGGPIRSGGGISTVSITSRLDFAFERRGGAERTWTAILSGNNFRASHDDFIRVPFTPLRRARSRAGKVCRFGGTFSTRGKREAEGRISHCSFCKALSENKNDLTNPTLRRDYTPTDDGAPSLIHCAGVDVQASRERWRSVCHPLRWRGSALRVVRTGYGEGRRGSRRAVCQSCTADLLLASEELP